MPGTFPTLSYKNTEIRITSSYPTLVSGSNNLSVTTRSRGLHRFSVNIVIPEIHTWAAYAPLFAFIEKQKGRSSSFDFPIPTVVMPCNGAWDGTELVVGATASGATEIDIDGAPADAVMKAGDLIQFTSHEKIYIVTDDVTFNGSGEGTVVLNTGLKTALVDNEVVKSHRRSSGLEMKCRFSSDENVYEPLNLGRYGKELTFYEDVS